MPPAPSGRLEFTDCLGCGKRVATTAKICRHCNTKRNVGSFATRSQSPQETVRAADANDDFNMESHASLSLGGYGKDDYDDEHIDDAQVEEENEKPSSGILTGLQGFWWFVALILLVFFLVSALLPQLW